MIDEPDELYEQTPEPEGEESEHEPGDPPEGYTDVTFVRVLVVTRRVHEADKNEAVKRAQLMLPACSPPEQAEPESILTDDYGPWKLHEVNGEEPVSVCETCSTVLFDEEEYVMAGGEDESYPMCKPCLKSAMEDGSVEVHQTE